MAEAIEFRDRMEWNRVSALLALISNCNRDPRKSKPTEPADWNPYLQKGKSSGKNVIVVNDAESRAAFKMAMTGSA